MDAAKKLQKAEAELKHGLEVLDKMQKPPTMTDDVFAKSKASATEQAHSGLGLVYFRERQAHGIGAELELSTTNANPDPADLYVLGRDYETLKRFRRCFQRLTRSALQSTDRCRAGASSAPIRPNSRPPRSRRPSHKQISP